MTSPSWSRIEDVFADALEHTGTARDHFLDVACAGDSALRHEVGQMLAAHDRGGRLAIEQRLAAGEASDDPWIGTRLGSYRLVHRLGEGGMGAVYLAERADGAFEQQVAIKVVRTPGARRAEALERFRQEQRILAALVHPGIARLIDAGLSPEGQPYLVMELVDGEPLTTHCDRQRLSVRARLALFRGVCDAVEHAHRNLVVHRDLKPSNIFVTPAGDVKLLDFGIAKLLGASDTTSDAPVTRTGIRPMTPEYAAPEQVAGGPITTATDVYALGVLLSELLTGHRHRDAAPFGAAAAAAHGRTRSTTPAKLTRLFGGDLDTIIAMARRAEPERRYASAGQLSEDIERALAGLPVRAQRDTNSYRLRRFVARHKVGVGLAAAVVTALIGFLAFSLHQSREIARERDSARAERDRADRVVNLLVGLFESTNPAVLPRGDRLTLGEFLPHAERRALQQLEGQPELAARMQFVLGRVAHARGRYADARGHLEQALTLRRQLAGAGDTETLDIVVALGATLLELRRQDEARPLLQDAYDRLRSGRDERAAEAALMLANAHGVTPEAERLLREALAIRRGAIPPVEAGLNRSLINLGNFLVFSNRLVEGVPLLEEALTRLDTPARRADPQLLTVLNDLAQARSRREELAEAERLHRRLLEVAPSIVEPESLPVANSLNNLGGVLAAQGRHGEAESFLRQSYALHEQLFGAPHGRTANVARNLGVVIGLQRRYGEAHAWLERAVALMSQSSSDVRAHAWMRAQRAAMAARLGRIDEARRDTAQAVADLGSADRAPLAAQLAESRLLLGGVLIGADRAAEAMAPLEAALAYFSTSSPVSAPKVASVQVELGRALAALGRCGEARARFAALDSYAAWGLAAPDRVKEAGQARARCAATARP